MYRIIIKKAAKRFIDKLSKAEKIRIVSALEKLPYTGDIKELKGHNGLYRLRVGTYRILYTVDNGEFIICIIDAGNRGDVYKKY